ncbi:hypothetical protein IW262DRAFT_1495353 [Armillaria fumosa]|nr:hypothetical protein IW262DRAFT_1495353 [Armillaria fumosa]
MPFTGIPGPIIFNQIVVCKYLEGLKTKMPAGSVVSDHGNSIPSLAGGLGALGAFIATILVAILIIKLKLRQLDRAHAKEDAAHTIRLAGITMDRERELPSTSLPVPVLTAEEQGPSPSLTTAPAAEEEDDSKYPFPVGPNKDGNFGVEMINMSLSSNLSTDYMEMCKQYNLAYSGTKPQWWYAEMEIKPSTPSMNCPQRHQEPWGHQRRHHKEANWPANTSVMGLSIQRSKDTRSQVEEILPWCRRVIARTADAMPQVPHHTHLLERRADSVSVGQLHSPSDPFENPVFTDRVASVIEAWLTAATSSTRVPPVAPTVLSPHPSMDIDTTNLGLTSHSVDISDAVDRPDSPTLPSVECLMLDGAAQSGGSKQCILHFADGTSLSFDQSAVPPTKPFCYASDLPSLIASWDDHSPDWNPTSDYPIKIYGRPIPIRLWKDLYCHNKALPTEWKQLKHVWGLWHEFMKSYWAVMPDKFWKRFSHRSGECFSFSQILEILWDEQKKVDADLTQRAIKEYGDQFASEFGYAGQNGHPWVTMEDTAKIAQLYRKKKGMESDNDD